MIFDLSKLPAPTSISTVDYDANFALLLNRFKDLVQDYDAYLESDPLIKIFEACAYVLTLKDQERNDQIKAVLISFSQGNDLDNLGGLLAEGRQEDEDDGRYRHRILTALDKASTAGVAEAYEALALASDSRVEDVKAYDDVDHPAKAFVTIKSSATENGTADNELLGVVSDYLNNEDRKPLGVQVSVNSVDVINYTIDASIKFYPNVDKEIVKSHMLDAVRLLVESKHKIAEEIALSEVYATLNIQGVSVVDELKQPTKNIKSGAHQTPFCTNINIVESV
jgi:phage-related baseplate assembly protein